MQREGRLNPASTGYAMPLDAALYATPPIHYRGVQAIMVTYETDMEAALDLLPDGLVIEGPALATLLFLNYPFSTLGAYKEAILVINCQYDGVPTSYIPHIVVDSEVPLAAGREIWGYPKKLAHIEVDTSSAVDVRWGRVERPRGHVICSGGIRPERLLDLSKAPTDAYNFALRVIPNPTAGRKPSLAELIRVHTVTTVHEAWAGPGWAQLNCVSQVDPWHKLRVKEIVAAQYQISDMILGHGEIVKTY